jgi:hypothetical protein
MLALLDTYAPEALRKVMQAEAQFYDPLKKAVMRSW